MPKQIYLQVKGRRRFGDSQVEYLEDCDVFENNGNGFDDIDQSANAEQSPFQIHHCARSIMIDDLSYLRFHMALELSTTSPMTNSTGTTGRKFHQRANNHSQLKNKQKTDTSQTSSLTSIAMLTMSFSKSKGTLYSHESN